MGRVTAFSPRQMFLLDEACRPLRKGLRATPWLVGSAVSGGSHRDVDVRTILPDDQYDRLVGLFGPDGVAFLGLAIGEYLAARTGLPIDFQIQRQTEANDKHVGERNPLGGRTLANYSGDAAPEIVP